MSYMLAVLFKSERWVVASSIGKLPATLPSQSSALVRAGSRDGKLGQFEPLVVRASLSAEAEPAVIQSMLSPISTVYAAKWI